MDVVLSTFRSHVRFEIKYVDSTASNRHLVIERVSCSKTFGPINLLFADTSAGMKWVYIGHNIVDQCHSMKYSMFCGENMESIQT